jgi:2-dehydro-3-deoxyphosphogluconate aldolase/(4S)-4-hydroxy-2-oxoglutarate aldolase
MGPQYIKALREPFPQVSFLPTGGISIQNMHEWFASGAIAVGMGGALTKGTLDQIREKVREALSRLLD